MTVAFSSQGAPLETSFNRRFAPPSAVTPLSAVTPAKAGVQSFTTLDSGLRRNDDQPVGRI